MELGQDGSQAEGGEKNQSCSLHWRVKGFNWILAPLQACFVGN